MEELALLRDLSIIWAAALVVGYLCVRLKQPIIAGYIVAGIVIGPYCLKLIDQSQQISVLAEFGVALLLFALGVEVSLRQIFSSAIKTILAALCQIFGTALLSWYLAELTGLSSGAGSGLLFGFICALSSSVVVTKVLMERGELDSTHGQILVPMLVIQDLALVPVISLLPVMKSTGGDAIGLVAIALAKASVFIVFIIWSATKLVPVILSRVAHSNYRELFLLTIISLCLLIAIVGHALGLSLALGAFLAGIMISESTYGHQALADLLPLRDLFSTVFFVSVGMLLNPSYIAEHWAQVALFVVVLIVGKALIAGAAASVATPNLRRASLVGIGLAQIGEFSFVLALNGYKSGILSESLYNLFFAGAVVSLTAAPFLMTSFPAVLRRLTSPGSKMDERRVEDRNRDGVSGMKGHVVLCGYGRIGRNLGMVLNSYSIPVVVIELNAAITGELEELQIPFVYGDALSRIVLLRANLRDAGVLVVTIPDPVAAMTIIDIARHYNPDIKIIARAHRSEDIDVFRATGANAVVQPEFEASIEITRLTLLSLNKADPEIQTALTSIRERRYSIFQPDIASSSMAQIVGFPHDEHTGAWFKVKGDDTVGKTIGDLDIRRATGATVAAIRRDDSVIPYPKPDTALIQDDEIYVVGNPNEVTNFEEAFLLPRFCPVSAVTSDEISNTR